MRSSSRKPKPLPPDPFRHQDLMAEAAEKNWRRLDGHNQLPKIILGVRFTDGIEVVKPKAQAAGLGSRLTGEDACRGAPLIWRPSGQGPPPAPHGHARGATALLIS